MSIEAPNSFFATTSEEQSRRARLPRGDRTKLAKRYFADLYTAWEEQGDSVLRRAAFHDPMGFARMVAGLMPQKLEIVHPTDGLTDERLAHLLELAERMAALRLGTADEKRLIDVTPERGVGGPDRVGVVAGEGCPSPDRDAAAPVSTDPSNPLDAAPPVDSTADRLITEGVNDSEREESDFAIQPPVGKPFPTLPETEKRDNLRKLTAEDDIDPASLF